MDTWDHELLDLSSLCNMTASELKKFDTVYTVQLQKIYVALINFYIAALSLYCMESLVRILKSKGGKPSFEQRLSAILVFAKVRQAAYYYE